MINHAENKRLKLDGVKTDYICFGSGEENLILLPGVGDAFKTAEGTALPMSVLYRKFKDYRVYLFSRRNDLPMGFTTEDMAADLAKAMDALEIEKAHVVGVSQGGMITQCLALDHPEKVDRLVLAVTCARPHKILEDIIGQWLTMAEAGDYENIMLDTAYRSYTGDYLEKNLRIYRMIAKVTKPKDFTRFRILCEACLTHDVYDRLREIEAPTYVMGGGRDLIVGPEAAEELAAAIPKSDLCVYRELSHGAYEQAKDFNDRILRFLRMPEVSRYSKNPLE